ncbi:MAG: elongation factor P [Holosporales bacterium]|jgi:elongation factor P|nr:elongation factor P [Holosporales bacterium]
MKIGTNEIRVGNVIEHMSKLWIVLKTQHVQPGKGGAFMQVEMKGLKDGSKLNERFRSADVVEKVFLEEVAYQFLYSDGNLLHFMDQNTFEQIQLSSDLIGESGQFLFEGMEVNICLYEGDPISVSLPSTVVLEIVEAEPVVKGQTATSSYKPAILSNGVKIMVPQHIESGAKVVVNTADASYVERAK